MRLNLSARQTTLIFLIITILFEISVAIIGRIDARDVWGDESHFYETSKDFGQEITLEKLTHYREMSTPLPFVIYGMWGRVVGFGLLNLRVLSIFIALITYWLFINTLLQARVRPWAALLSAIFLMIHPYMVGLSIFVFTDMITILFLLLSYRALNQNSPLQYGLFLALALSSRQYAAFIVPVGLVMAFTRWRTGEPKDAWRLIIATVVGILPLAILCLLWGGLSPDNEWRQLYLDEGLYFKMNIFFLYAALLFVYLLPFYPFVWRRFYVNRNVWIVSVLLSLLYFLFPITPAKYSVAIGVQTVGFLHKALDNLIGSSAIVQGIFYMFALLGLPVLITFVKEALASLKTNGKSSLAILNLSIICFFAAMPFSYLGWEKYFMTILPFVILSLTQFQFPAAPVRK